MASLDDILTTAKNIVVAINTAATNYMQVNGQRTALALSGDTLVKASPGRLCSINVITAGADGAAYDINSTSGVAAANQLAIIPATAGPLVINLPFATGLVISPGAGQVVTVSYS